MKEQTAGSKADEGQSKITINRKLGAGKKPTVVGGSGGGATSSK